VPVVLGSLPPRQLVAYFRPVDLDTLLARLVVADPSTGDDVATSDPMLFTEPPQPCDDGHDVCARTMDRDATEGRVRIDLRSDEAVDEPEPPADSQRAIGDDGLTDLRAGGVQYLARVDRDQVLWRTPVSQAFGSGWSSDGGWDWDHYGDQGLFVGSIGKDPRTAGDVADLSDDKIVALDDRTGQVRWASEGTGISCLYSLALPTGPESDPEHHGIPLRCRLTGTAKRSDHPEVTNFDAKLERFDVTTGKARWSVDLGDAEALLGTGDVGVVGAVVDRHSIVVPRGDSTSVLDLDDGTTRAIRADEQVGCPSKIVEFEYAVPYPGANGSTKKRIGGVLAHACDAHLHQKSKPLTPAVARAMGPTIGATSIVAENEYLVGYDAG